MAKISVSLSEDTNDEPSVSQRKSPNTERVNYARGELMFGQSPGLKASASSPLIKKTGGDDQNPHYSSRKPGDDIQDDTTLMTSHAPVFRNDSDDSTYQNS